MHLVEKLFKYILYKVKCIEDEDTIMITKELKI